MGNAKSRLATVLALAAVAATIFVGTVLRLADPLSTDVIPAEDPYTHMAIVREDLRQGEFNSLSPDGGVYPPGLHAFLAAAWVFTGADLYEIVRVGPAILGAIGILGIAILLWRHAGPVAAFVGSLGMAVAPEAIFRTGMMAPTALDLAVIPFFLYALLELTTGRLAWAGVAAPLGLFLVFAHPWLFAIFAVSGAVFVALVYLLPWARSLQDRPAVLGYAATIAIVGGGLGLSLSSCGGKCGPGFVDLVPALSGQVWIALLIIAVSFVPLALLLARPNLAPGFLLPKDAPTRSLITRIAASTLIAGVLLVATWLAHQQGMPSLVDLPRMIGWPILVLGFFALVALPFLAGRLAHLGAALFAATYPFVIFNPLNSPFWPHRTVVFLALALVILTGVAAGAVARWVVQAVTAAQTSTNPSKVRSRRYGAMAAALFVVVACSGTVYAGTPDAYPGGWYRLYPECELDALKDLSDVANASPAAVVIVGSWEARLVLAALTDDAYRIWYKPEFFGDPDERDRLLVHLESENRPAIVITDRFFASEHPELSAGFLNEPPWQPMGSYCGSQGTGQPRLLAYQTGGPQ